MDTRTSTASDWPSSPALPPSASLPAAAEDSENDSHAVEENDMCYPGCQLYLFVTSTLIIGMLCTLGLVGNTASFVVFVKDSIKTSTLFLFQSLCVIDNLLLITVFPLYCFEPFVCYTGLYTSYLDQGHYFVNMYVFPLASVSQTATIWVTVLVGINRYIAVCKPYQAARLCTVRQAKMQLTVVLIFAVLYNVTRFAERYPKFVPAAANGTSYHIQPTETELGQNQLYVFIYDSILYMIFMLILPLFVLAVLNIRLVKALKRLRRKRVEMQSATQRQDNNVTLVLIIVIIVFIICQTPALANRFMWSVLDDPARDCGGFQFYFSRLSNTLVITNSAVNFLIYLLFNTRFKQILVKGVFCCRSSKQEGGGGGGGGHHHHQQQSYSVIRSSQNTASNSTNHSHKHHPRPIRESPESQTGVTL